MEFSERLYYNGSSFRQRGHRNYDSDASYRGEQYYECDEEKTYYSESGETYDQYNGTWAQDVEELSDQFINDVLDGGPDAYWNID